MTKAEFLKMFAAMYRVGNASDSPEVREDWTQPDMAGFACCRLLDQMKRELIKIGVVTEEEMDELYDTL